VAAHLGGDTRVAAGAFPYTRGALSVWLLIGIVVFVAVAFLPLYVLQSNATRQAVTQQKARAAGIAVFCLQRGLATGPIHQPGDSTQNTFQLHGLVNPFWSPGDRVMSFVDRATEPRHQPGEPVEFELLFKFCDGFVNRVPELLRSEYSSTR
jgi:hypothetical protein